MIVDSDEDKSDWYREEVITMATKSPRRRGIFKRGNVWYISYKQNGKHIRESVGPKYEDAVTVLHMRKLQIQESKFESKFGLKRRKDRLPKFKDIAERFLIEYCDAPGKKKSLRGFHQNNLRALIPYFGHMRLDEITTWHIRKYKMDRVRQISEHTERQVSTSTFNRERSTISLIFNVARRHWGYQIMNPVTDVERYPDSLARTEYLEVDEINALITAADLYFKPILICAVHTGMRKGEILGLKWCDIDLRRRVITLTEGKTIKEKAQYISMDDTMYDLFTELRTKAGSEYVFEEKPGSGRLICIKRPFDRALKKSGVAEERRKAGKKRFRFHDLRHTCASQMTMAGVPLTAVQAMLRHSDLRTTQRYAHLSPGFMQQAVRALDSRLRSSTKSSTVVDFEAKAETAPTTKNPLRKGDFS